MGRRWVALGALLLGGCTVSFGIREVGEPPPDVPVRTYSTAGGALEDTIDVKVTTPPAAHDLLVVAVATFWNTAAPPTDTAGNDYQAIGGPVISTAHSTLYMFYVADAKTADPFTMTVSTQADVGHPSQVQVTAAVHVYQGTGVADPLDKISPGQGAGTGSPIIAACGPVTTAYPGEVLVAATTHDFSGTTIAGADYTLRTQPATDHIANATLTTEDQLADVVTSTATFSSMPTTGQPSWACLLSTFRL